MLLQCNSIGHVIHQRISPVHVLNLLTRCSKYKNRIRVLAFASPPVMDSETSVLCQPFITTVVTNFDVIPRAPIANIVHLQLYLAELDEVGDKMMWKRYSGTQFIFLIYFV